MKKTSLKSTKSSINDIKTTSKKHDDTSTDGLSRSISLIDGTGGKQRVAPAEIFTFRELAVATENFNPDLLLGQGGYGRVYKGFLKSTNQVVAIKQLDRNGIEDDKDFLAEVRALSTVHHENLVNIIGYCAAGRQRILVYEYMQSGSLENYLFDVQPTQTVIDWHTRMKIAQGAARGLEYLHDMVSPPVVFADLKASSILLDEEFNPKLSDFGLAHLGPTNDQHHDNVSTRVLGTYGYCAPEYALTGQLSTKSDVYTFGVVLLEIISGRRVIDSTKPPEEENLVDWAKPIFNDRSKFVLLADPLLEGKYPMKALYQAIAVVAMCLAPEASTRPLIGDVVTALEYLALLTEEGASESDV